MTMNSTPKNDPPIDRVKNVNATIQVPIWRNVDTDGKVTYSTTPAERSYFDKQEDRYKTTATLFNEDNLEVAKLYDRAYERIRELREADYEAKKANAEQQAA
jgi:hypothetical protein